MITGYAAIAIFLLAAFAGYEVISRVPVILHTPLMSGSNFIHGVVVVGAVVALGSAETTAQRVIGTIAVVLGTANAVGGYAVTERMLEMFRSSASARRPAEPADTSEGRPPERLDASEGRFSDPSSASARRPAEPAGPREEQGT